MVPAVLLAAVYMIWSPPSADLAAQAFRAELFEQHGFEAWSSAWYGGMHLPGYSLLFPPLASLLGARLVGALSVLAATALFAALVRAHYGPSATPAIWLFGLGSAAMLFTGRLTFALGLVIGLAALLALDRKRAVWAGFLAALSSWASPVAGLFVAFAGGVLFVRGRRRDGLVLALPALVAIATLVLAFPSGGAHPFVANTFVLISAATLIFVFVLPRDEGTLRAGALLYLALCVVLFAIDTPVGGNATRLGALVAAPLLALGAWGRRSPALLVIALLPLVYWQLVAPVRDVLNAAGEDSVEVEYYEPLLEQIDRRAPQEPFRVHVPPTEIRWEARWIAPRYPLARGWLRQVEADDFDLFQHGNLSATSYRRWLDDRGAAFVAISAGAEPDYLSRDEIDLIHAGLPYLREVWSSTDWELYKVREPAPLVQAPARLARLDGEAFEVDVPGAGEYRIAVRYSPYFQVMDGDGCVREDGEWSTLEVAQAGVIRIAADFTLSGIGRALARSREVCST